MTTKIKGTEGIEFPDATVQASAAYGKNEFFSGQVLQQRLFTDGGNSSLAATLANTSQSTKNFTPKSTNSKIHVSVSFYGAASSGGTFINTQLNDNTVGLIGTMNSHGLTVAGNQAVGGWMQEAIVDNTALTERGFTLWANNAVGAGGSLTNQVWSITEVQN